MLNVINLMHDTHFAFYGAIRAMTIETMTPRSGP